MFGSYLVLPETWAQVADVLDPLGAANVTLLPGMLDLTQWTLHTRPRALSVGFCPP